MTLFTNRENFIFHIYFILLTYLSLPRSARDNDSNLYQFRHDHLPFMSHLCLFVKENRLVKLKLQKKKIWFDFIFPQWNIIIFALFFVSLYISLN